jgi:hypothetical protein
VGGGETIGGTVTSAQIDRQALHFGFRLEETEVDGVHIWQWQRGDRQSPAFLNADAARSWMDTALRTASLFNN